MKKITSPMSRRQTLGTLVGAGMTPWLFASSSAIAGGTVVPPPPPPPAPPTGPVTGNTNRASWAISSDPGTYAQALAAQFTNPLVNPLTATAISGSVTAFYKPDVGSTSRYTVTARQTQADILGVPGKLTTVWGYGNYETAAPTYPGRSFQVRANVPVDVVWKNQLNTATGPLPHLLPVDQSISLKTPTTGVPLAVHHHGGDTAAEFDGGPDQWSTPSRQQIGPGITAATLGADPAGIRFNYTNAQEASMHWYHDHAEGLTRINVHAGLAGLYVIRDANEDVLTQTNVIPAAPYEVGLVLQDRCFDAKGNLVYSADPVNYPDPAAQAALPGNTPTHMPEMFGDIIVVNGKAWPNMKVEPRPYRLRLLNGADSRFFTLAFGTAPIYLIGTDLGLLNNGVRMTSVTIAPGERMDLVVDFTALAGKRFVVSNSAPTPFPGGAVPVGGEAAVMRFEVTLPLNRAVPFTSPGILPLFPLRIWKNTALLSPAARVASLPATTVTRRVLLAEGVDQYGRITPLLGTYNPTNAAANLGTLGFADPATELPKLGSTEIWEFWNVSVDAHPVHMHLVQFQVIDRRAFAAPRLGATTMANGWTGVKLLAPPAWAGAARPSPASEAGWKDTVVCPPGEVTRVVVSFPRRGKYVYHCHILSHEEHDMMRWYQVV